MRSRPEFRSRPRGTASPPIASPNRAFVTPGYISVSPEKSTKQIGLRSSQITPAGNRETGKILNALVSGGHYWRRESSLADGRRSPGARRSPEVGGIPCHDPRSRSTLSRSPGQTPSSGWSSSPAASPRAATTASSSSARPVASRAASSSAPSRTRPTSSPATPRRSRSSASFSSTPTNLSSLTTPTACTPSPPASDS